MACVSIAVVSFLDPAETASSRHFPGAGAQGSCVATLARACSYINIDTFAFLRPNRLSSVANYPLKHKLAEGIGTVMGTDVVASGSAPQPIFDFPPADSGFRAAARGEATPACRAIVEAVRDCTQPASAPGPWSFLPKSDSFREFDKEVRYELLKLFEHEYDPNALLNSGIVVGKPGALRLSPIIEKATLIEFGKTEDGALNLATDEGELLEQGQAFVRLATARQPAAEKQVNLLVVGSLADLLVVRQIGFSTAICAAGIDHLRGDQFAKLLDDTDASPSSWKYSFVFANWNIAKVVCQPPPLMAKVIKHFARAERQYNFRPTERFRIWTPSHDTLESLRDAAALSDAAHAKKIIDAAAATALINGQTWSGFLPKAPVTIEQAYAALSKAYKNFQRQRTPKPELFKQLLAEYRNALEAGILRPMRADAEKARTPGLRQAHMMLAKFSQLFHTFDPLVRAVEDVVADKVPTPLNDTDLDELPSILKLTNVILALSKFTN